jgi:hypothetical protein
MLLVAATPPGCGGARFEGNTYRGDGVAFRIPPPPRHWEPIDHSHAALAFRDAPNRATIMINARCGLDGEDVPLVALTNHLFLQFTEREIRAREVVPFDGREAMHSELTAKLDGVPMSFDVWVLKKDGCVYDLLYVAPVGVGEGGLASFRAVVQGFATVDPDAE